jgi:SAM-dependent methyltransferase
VSAGTAGGARTGPTGRAPGGSTGPATGGVRLRPLPARVGRYGTTGAGGSAAAGASPLTTTEDYAADQERHNEAKTLDFLLPLVEAAGARSVLDVGCGVGTSVATLLERGYDAFGADLAALVPFWERLGRPAERFVIVDAERLVLPFDDGALDFAFSIGAIEHVGTSDGHARRRPDCHALRTQWVREIWRTLRPGGTLLLGGPNRGFPVDVAHGLDADAAGWERRLSRWAGASVHRTLGDYFLWSYSDLRRYLAGLDCTIEALPVRGLLGFSRVPAPLRPLVRLYAERLPGPLRATGFNPWMLALVRKPAAR